MNKTLSESIPTATPGSWWGVLLILLALVGLAGGIVAAWWPAVPALHSPGEVERYYPLTSGTSLLYRVTSPDGAVRYRSSNVEQLPGSDVVPLLDVNSFVSLMTTLGLDVNDFDVDAAQATVAATRFARVVETEYAATGAFTTTTTLLLPGPASTRILWTGDITFDPPMPMLGDMSAVNAPQVFTGVVNRSVPYTATLVLEGYEALDTPVGHLEDCVRVRHRIVVPGYDGYDVTWYCAGIGAVQQEIGWTGDASYERSELVSVSAPGRVMAAAPPLPLESSPRAELSRTFPHSVGDQLPLLWSYQEPRSNSGITTPVLPADGLLLYATQNGGLLALDRQGQLRWRFQTGSAVYGTPAVADGMAYVASADRQVYALDLASGAFRWAFATGDLIPGSPAVDGGLVYVGSEDRTVYALDARSGQERWRFTTGDPVATTPVVAGGVVYVGSDDGVLYALDGQTGAVRWAYTAEEAITAAAVVQDGVVYVGSYDKMLYALKAQTDRPEGELLWSYYAREEVTTDVTVADGLLYLALRQDLLALDAATGAEQWRYRSTSDLRGAPLRFGDALLIRREHDVLVLDALTGIERNVVPTTESPAFAGLSSDGQQLFVGHFDGLLQVFGLERSAP